MEFNTREYFEWCPYNYISTLCRAKDECYDPYWGVWHGSQIGGFVVEESGGKGGDTKEGEEDHGRQRKAWNKGQG